MTAHLVIGTAGHVDHGKTALIRALTGVDTDRLPEEKRRGISIDLGFTRVQLPDGREASVVDVPGHERFIRNMVAGVVGIDVVLLVVAADEGVMPQTREHLNILQLLGVQSGLVVLTKIDLVEAEWLDLVEEEVREALRGTFLAGSPILRVSSLTGEGLPGLLQALAELLPQVPARDAEAAARLPVDRVFSLAGFGTVVTGTLVAGTIRVEDRLELLPAGRAVRVRQVQVHGKPVEAAQAGQRCALNLPGLETSEVARGDVLAAPGTLQASWTFAGQLRLLPDAPRPLRNEERVRLHAGTSETMGRVLLLDRQELLPGDEGPIQFKAERELVLARGDRFILRTFSPMHTIGGGEVLEPARRFKRFRAAHLEELRLRRSGEAADLLRALLAEGKPCGRQELARRAGLAPRASDAALQQLVAGGEAVLIGEEAVVSAGTYRRWRARLEETFEHFYRAHPLRWGPAREEVRRSLWPELDVKTSNALLQKLVQEGAVELRGEHLCRSGWQPRLGPVEEQVKAALETAFREAGTRPPGREEVAELTRPAGERGRDLLYLLVDDGTLVRVEEDLYFHRAALEETRQRLKEYLLAHGEISMAELRDLLGTTRKYGVPLGEYFDATNLTRRVGDVRRLA